MRVFSAGLALVSLLCSVACGPPSAPPVRFGDVDVGAGTRDTFWCASFTLLDASGNVTTMAGELTYSVRDAAGSEVCRIAASTNEATYLENSGWGAVLCATVPYRTCPPLSAGDDRRTVVLTLASAGTTVSSGPVDAPVAMFHPRAPPPPLVVVPPTPIASPPPVVAVDPIAADGWIVSPALHARVNAPGATASPPRSTPLGASDVLLIGASDDCRVELGRWPTLAVNGAALRARCASNGDPITVDAVTAERWHLEYEHGGYLYVSVGVVEPGGATAIVCRVDYPTGQDANRACSARICESLLLDPAVDGDGVE